MSAAQQKYARSPEGKRALRKRIKKAQAMRHANRNGASAGHTPSKKETGRAMLVALARPEAARKIVALQREIETLTLFLEKTKP